MGDLDCSRCGSVVLATSNFCGMCGQACRDLDSRSDATTRSCGSALEDEVALAGRSRSSRALLLSLQSAAVGGHPELAGDETPPHMRRLWTLDVPHRVDPFSLRSGRPPRVLMLSSPHLKNRGVSIVGDHMDLILDNGGLPVIIPRTTKCASHLSEYLPMDGLIIAEGNALCDEMLQKYGCSVPGLVGDEPLESASRGPSGDFDVSQDELEFALLRLALAAKCPILAVSRGSQMLNSMRGGSFMRDVRAEVGDQVPHAGPGSDGTCDSLRHSISVKAYTPMEEWFSDSLGTTEELLVNSDHCQAVEQLGENLVEMARAPDGVLEAFYDPSYNVDEGKFVVGLQFHPGRMLSDYPGCAEVYKAFVEASWAYKALQDCSA
mmetsp:Transcript_53553/g.115719  ORF Transcript_53553/g.115719 Transcript_53553/m.115719 type:complete len:378 (-) Transcript_53553:113-1246(-)|eukprot:CAMPEP_0170605372 /NCGR_PEP_ID=MMETSP0224-20130122/19939_1 /TAXON_ID=285029 /ORGANISM="Togula jolla, Strain CCCM 725" /LENGTH=377 /DNA_ID=CAMNT_0010930373 /DNA_START=51 /DNA_END=1184 /DNA_ORIENTATION=-